MPRTASIPPADLGPDIQRFLAAFAARKELLQTLAALGWALALGMAWLEGQCLADRWLALPAWARLALLATGAALTMVPLVAQFLRLRRRPDWRQIAAEIEQRDPQFQQRLETLASQFSFPPALRGSPQMLDQLLSQVAAQTRRRRAAALVSWKNLPTPWMAAALLALLRMGLCNVPYLQFPQLLRRALQPTAPLGAVSVTQLEVQTGDAAVLQGSALTIRVLASRLGQKPLRLYLGGGGGTYSEVEMRRQTTADAAALFTFTLGGVDGDLCYYVRGGDAVSRIYNIRVQRIPTVARYDVLYHYPPATHRLPQEVESADGRLDAPAGTSADVTLSVTEPLRSALVRIEGRSLPLTPAGASAWKITLPIKSDMTCPLELTSVQGVASSALSLSLHAIADHPPLVRLLQGGVPDLLLEPRQVLRLRYEAVDDYQVDNLALRILGSGGEILKPLPLRAAAPHVEGTVLLDLASLNVSVGDVLSLWVGAQRASQPWSWSTPSRHILVVAHALGPAHWQCLAELKSAAAIAADWIGALDRARRAWETLREADPASPNRWALLVSAQHACADSADSAADLRLALLRALLQSQIADAETPPADAGSGQGQPPPWPDAALGGALAADADLTLLIAADIATSRDAESPSLLIASTTQARTLAQQLTTLWQGQAAAAALRMRADLAAFGPKITTTAPATVNALAPALRGAERKAAALAQAHQTLDALIADLGLKPEAADLDNALTRRIAAASSLALTQQEKDWSAVIGQWDAHNDPGGAALLGQRLELAAQTQALRASGSQQLLWARDLHLAGRALAALQRPKTDPVALVRTAAELPALLDVLRQEDFFPSTAARADAAAAARNRLDAWAPPPPARQIATLVFDANAASALDSDRADALDKDLLDALAAAAPDEAARFKPSLLQLGAELAGLRRTTQQQEDLLRQATQEAQVLECRRAIDQLHRSSRQTLLRLARQRLQMIPSLAALFAPSDEEPAASVLAASFLRSAGLGRWGHATTLPEGEAPAYQEAVRAYFDTLAHSRDEKSKR